MRDFIVGFVNLSEIVHEKIEKIERYKKRFTKKVELGSQNCRFINISKAVCTIL